MRCQRLSRPDNDYADIDGKFWRPLTDFKGTIKQKNVLGFVDLSNSNILKTWNWGLPKAKIVFSRTLFFVHDSNSIGLDPQRTIKNVIFQRITTILKKELGYLNVLYITSHVIQLWFKNHHTI